MKKRRMRNIDEQEERCRAFKQLLESEALGLMRRRQKVEAAVLTNGRITVEAKNKSEELKKQKGI
jgi:hypothetical protein